MRLNLAHALTAMAFSSLLRAHSVLAADSPVMPPPEVQLIRSSEAGDRTDALQAIRSGVSVQAHDADGTTALHWAASHGDAELVRALLAAGADARAKNEFGASPMSAAAEIGDARVIELLLKAGADVDSANAEGETALMVVARTGKIDAARELLKHGAKPDVREQWGGQTALMWAAAECQPEMIRLLLDHGASINLRGATRDWQRRVTAEPRPKDMSHGGFSALLYASREGCVAGARELVKRKVDLNLADPDGVTPLIMALMNIHWDMGRFLIEAGADVNLWDLYGRAPLYAAVDMNTLPKGRHVELPALDETSGLTVIGMLLDRGANPNAQLKLRVPHRQIPYDRYTEPLLNIGATPLLRAAKAGDVEVVKLLLAHGALPDLPNFNGDTPLMAAVGKGWINAPTRGAFYTEDQAIQVYGLLRGAGADVNAHTHFNETPLHSAALRGWNVIVKRLVADGAALDARDNNGLTPIDFAMGRFPKEFNAVLPTVRNDTADLLKSLGAKVENPSPPAWPVPSTPRITAWLPSETALLPPQ
jgi:ankyrin repeat protein